jgi:hypothetical protein
MKAEAGWGAAALLATAAFVGVTSQPGGKGVAVAPPGGGVASPVQRTTATQKTPFERGPCEDLEEKIQRFFLATPEGIAAPDFCYDEATPASQAADAAKDAAGAKGLRASAAGLRYVIAIVPDPLHTHFSLSFDRFVEAIQQGAQDEGYLYDSSWMPWETEKPSLILLADQDREDDRTKAREEQPGIMLFRKTTDPNGVADPYLQGLAVLVVGEEPTSGVHKRQFQNAVNWINSLQPESGGTPEPLKVPASILGPSFSGSLASLAQLLTDKEQFKKVSNLYSSGNGKPLIAYSGGITSYGAVTRFVAAVKDTRAVRFRSFQQSDEMAIARYRRYLAREGFNISRLAIVSEDETAFGGYANGARADANDPLCGRIEGENERDKDKSTAKEDEKEKEKDEVPTCLYYPRDISALRNAYQKQSIFNTGSTQSAAETAQRTLSTDIADPESQQHDTVRNYSGNQSALSQEAMLQQVVSMLRAHQSEYVVLRSSNPLDQLFLSHYLRLAYPEGRIVIQGADLLLRRESGAATLSGIMTLTTYPLLPWEQHWTRLDPGEILHSHKVFAQDIAEGTYIAARSLIEGEAFDGECGNDPSLFLPPDCGKHPIRNYVAPFWASPKCSEGVPPCAASRRPSTWLSVLGRDGFWPIAALNEATVPPGQAKPVVAAIPSWVVWPPVPLSMKICLAVIVILAIFHLQCCAFPSLTVKPSYRAHFVRIPGASHPALIVLGSVAVTGIPVLLAWGYGGMSQSGEPLPHPWLYWFFLPLIWAIAGAGVWWNSRVERRLAPPAEKSHSLAWSTWWPWLLLLIYMASTWIFYLIVDSSLEDALNPANRLPTYWRAMNLTSGVSPLVPLLALAAGFYCWFWYSLYGLALFGESRPLLPREDGLAIEWPDKTRHQFLTMYGGERMGRPIEALCAPFDRRAAIIFAGWFVVLLLTGLLLADGFVPIRSLGANSYARFYCIGLDVCLSLILANAWQLLRIWFRLRQLLVFLDRLPLRRTMMALRGYSWGSVWKMGGNILDVRYKLFYRQFESLNHLSNSFAREGSLHDAKWKAHIDATHKARGVFGDWYAENWDKWTARDLTALKDFQGSVADAAGAMLAKLLAPRWRSEEESLVLELSDKKSVVVEVADGKSVLIEASEREKDKRVQQSTGDDLPDLFRNAEELVCLVYLGFVQNVLGRMRTIVMQMVLLFVAATISVATYPFDPRPVLSGSMAVIFVILGVVVVIVYAQMCRDATLSHVTNTNPGELGSEFWFKLIGFGLGPALGLLATLFPEFPGWLFSWLQPGVSALK